MPQVPLTDCPGCGYSLQGLPVRYRCPECAFEYDEHTRVWKPKRPLVGMWGLIAILVFDLVLLAQNVGVSNLPAPGPGTTPRAIQVNVILRRVHLVLFPGLLLAVGLQVYRVLRYRQACKDGIYVAVTPTGISARTSSGCGTMTWEQIEGIGNPRDPDRLIVIKSDYARSDAARSFRRAAVWQLLWKSQDREQFVESVRAGLRRAGERQASQVVEA